MLYYYFSLIIDSLKEKIQVNASEIIVAILAIRRYFKSPKLKVDNNSLRNY